MKGTRAITSYLTLSKKLLNLFVSPAAQVVADTPMPEKIQTNFSLSLAQSFGSFRINYIHVNMVV